MLQGAMRELRLGNPGELTVDVGPVIDEAARAGLLKHIEAMRQKGRRVTQFVENTEANNALAQGHFVPPTLIEIESMAELEREVFGPVLHVLRYSRAGLNALLDQIHATGYGLTLGLHTRIDETVQQVLGHAEVGNIYVNRNMVGAVVGVQPFGGECLSGTGPKAGGPLYMLRLLSCRPATAATNLLAHRSQILPGPTGESNVYSLHPRQAVLCLADSDTARLAQLSAIRAVGSRAIWPAEAAAQFAGLAADAREHIALVDDWRHPGVFFDLVLHDGDNASLSEVAQYLATRYGPIISIVATHNGQNEIPLERLLVERSVSINTAAAGGNASLMMVG
jgi:RHH-type proline utilization regulon transcriptional repressor/proline dehydrogenase/delta 1-pyrroline-5-carboxylate dehydrogenase